MIEQRSLSRLMIGMYALLLAGCVTPGPLNDAETMYVKASALTKLSASVESTVRYKSPPEGIPDSELLTLSTAHDPALLAPFTGYTVKVLRQDRHAVVLVCSADGARGLLEDAGCTAAMDVHHWQAGASVCAFTLVPATVCARP